MPSTPVPPLAGAARPRRAAASPAHCWAGHQHPTGRRAPLLFEGKLHVLAEHFTPQTNEENIITISKYFSQKLHENLVSVLESLVVYCK